MAELDLRPSFADACKTYTGNSETLRGAIGAAVMCQHYGWKAVKLIHSYRAWRKYKDLLGIDFEEEFPEETELASRFVAYKVWKACGRFWDTQRHKVIPPGNKRDIVDSDF